MAAMWQHDLTLERIRPLAGRLLLGVFLLAAQLAPVAHLATHRPDHTHGPETGHDHEAAPRAAHSHDHDHDGTAPADPASSEHGRASAAHFDLALLAGPPPPFLPPPAETLAPPPDAVARWHHAPALPQPPARGPPHSR